MKAVFDALDAYILAGKWTTSTATVILDGSGISHSITGTDRVSQNSEQYSERQGATRVSVKPANAVLGPFQTITFTATAEDATGAPISGATFTWAVQQGAVGSIVPATGVYTTPGFTEAASDTVTATTSTGTAWSSVQIRLDPTKG